MCGELYKLKEGNSVRGGVSWINLERSSSRGGASRKTATGCEPSQSIAGRRKSAFRQVLRWPVMAVKQPMAPRRGAREKGFTVRLQPRKELR